MVQEREATLLPVVRRASAAMLIKGWKEIEVGWGGLSFDRDGKGGGAAIMEWA